MNKKYIKPELIVTTICNNSIMNGSLGYGEGSSDTTSKDENQFSKGNGSYNIWDDDED